MMREDGNGKGRVQAVFYIYFKLSRRSLSW